jgi:LPS sulfotransferase NodH
MSILDTINRLPIIIVANYRTGSSALGRHLAERHAVDWIAEPYHFPERRTRLQQHCANNTPYVAKIIVDQLLELDVHQTALHSQCFKIRLIRDNLVEQVVSYYIASQKNQWRQAVPIIPSYEVPVDVATMELVANKIISNNVLLRNLPIKFDLDLSYEALNFDELPQKANYKTTQPTNRDTIVELAKQVICDIG